MEYTNLSLWNDIYFYILLKMERGTEWNKIVWDMKLTCQFIESGLLIQIIIYFKSKLKYFSDDVSHLWKIFMVKRKST